MLHDQEQPPLPIWDYLIVAKTGFQLDGIDPKKQEIAKIKHPILATLRGGFKCYKVFKCCKFLVHSMRLKNCYRQITGCSTGSQYS